jgi:hypothetical protein
MKNIIAVLAPGYGSPITLALVKARMAARCRSASVNLPPNAGELPDAIGISGIGGGGDVKLSKMTANALSK